MTDRMLDPSIHRSATEVWYVSGRASQRDRYAHCLDMLAARLPAPGLVYDLGAGTGHFARLLATRARQVVGIERLPERVQICRATHEGVANLRFIEGDVLDLDLPAGTADAVSALEMLYYVAPETWPRFFDTVARLLRPCGLLLVSLNVFSQEGAAGEQDLLKAVSERFRIVETRHMHRMHYYRLELPLIRLLDEITYLERVKVFYPHTLSIGHVVYSPRLDRLLLPPNRLLDRIALPALRRAALALLGSQSLYGLVTGVSRLVSPQASRSQVLVLAERKT
ncbi:MAG: class I SAM-dependent methyltransferase [Methylacidiphilales bacterium]|nr:class I SAM-dependent methyltransferase [Candidatus Methylacidiphilales bacterium]